MEIALLPPSHHGPFPGLHLFTGISRVMRPVLHLATGKVELVGSLEQAYLNIASQDIDVRPHVTTHRKISPMNMLSVVASLTPYSDCNQSPRNMLSCSFFFSS